MFFRINGNIAKRITAAASKIDALIWIVVGAPILSAKAPLIKEPSGMNPKKVNVKMPITRPRNSSVTLIWTSVLLKLTITMKPHPVPNRARNDVGRILVNEKMKRNNGITNVPMVNNLPLG